MLITNHSHSPNTHSPLFYYRPSQMIYTAHHHTQFGIAFFIMHTTQRNTAPDHWKRHHHTQTQCCTHWLNMQMSHANTSLLHPIMIYHVEMSDTDPSHHHHKHIYHHQKNHHHEKQITTSHTCCSESQFPISCCFMTYDTITIRWEHNLSKPPNTFAEKLP